MAAGFAVCPARPPRAAYAPSTRLLPPPTVAAGGEGGLGATSRADGGTSRLALEATTRRTERSGAAADGVGSASGGGKGGGGRQQLSGAVGKEWQGIVLTTNDKMGNLCTAGGANVQIAPKLFQSGGGAATAATALETNCVDNDDGTYSLQWRSEVSGTYALHVAIDGAHVVGSPATLVMLSSSPEVASCEVSGAGLSRAIAGKSAVVRVRLRDRYGNKALPSEDMSFGMAMLPAEAAKDSVSSKKKAPRIPGEAASAAGDADEERRNAKRDRFASVSASMPYDGCWVGDEYEMKYVAEVAGQFELNVWCTLGGAQEKLPGAPFSLHVSEGQPEAGSSTVEGDEVALAGTCAAGERFALSIQLRDHYGNAAGVESDGALVALLESPVEDGAGGAAPPAAGVGSPGGGGGGIGIGSSPGGGGGGGGSPGGVGGGGSGNTPQAQQTPPTQQTQLALRAKGGLGEFDAQYDPHLRGRHVVHVRLHGADLRGSPIIVDCVPSAPVASKSRLHPPLEPTVTHAPCMMLIEMLDRFGNHVGRGGSRVDARAMGPSAGPCTVEDRKDGTYVLEFTAMAVGDYKVSVRLDNKDELAPLTLNFVEGRKPERAGERGAAGAPGAAPGARSRRPQRRMRPRRARRAWPPMRHPMLLRPQPPRPHRHRRLRRRLRHLPRRRLHPMRPWLRARHPQQATPP